MKAHHLEFIEVLKVVIEGSEKELFEDSPPWLAKVGVIGAELHDGLRPVAAAEAFTWQLRISTLNFESARTYSSPERDASVSHWRRDSLHVHDRARPVFLWRTATSRVILRASFHWHE